MSERRRFEELIAEIEADPKMREGLAEARRWVAREFYAPGMPQYERLMRGEGPPRAPSNGTGERNGT